MTAKQFMDSINGKCIDMDGFPPENPYQCVDVIKKYFVDVIGIPAIRNNAIDYWTNYPTSQFVRITNTPSFVPQRGDIMIWGKGVGQYGHIAIIDTANVNTFVSMDQNYPLGSCCHYQNHNYTSVLGVLRPKKDVNFDQAAYEAEQAITAEQNRLLAEAAKAEADRKAAEEAARVKAEQERLAREQAKLEAELKAKAEADAKAEREKNMSKKYSLNKADLISIGKGFAITLAGAGLTYIAEIITNIDFGQYAVVAVPVAAFVINTARKYLQGK